MILIMTNEAYIEALERVLKQFIEGHDAGIKMNRVRWYRIFKDILELRK